MADPIVYKSTDSGAPTLNGSKGSLITVLKACLISGYGAKTAAGWTIAVEDAPNNKIIFRNNTVDGSGLYFRVQDNGIVTSNPISALYASERPCQAAIIGCHGYTDIDTPIVPFPRVINANSVHDSYAYGVTVRKSYAPNSNSAPWMIIADNRTCYVFTFTVNSSTTSLTSSCVAKGICGFGDIKRLNVNNAALPKGFVLGSYVGYIDVNPGGYNVGEIDTFYTNSGYIRANYTEGYGGGYYLSQSLQSGVDGVSAFIKGMHFSRLGGNCATNAAAGTYMAYPSPGTVGFEINPLLIIENPEDTIRLATWSALYSTEVGLLPGLNGCPHSTGAAASGRVGDELSTITDGNNSYLLTSIKKPSNFDGNAQLLAIDLGDWWV